MIMAYKKKKRAEKYDEKLKINASFDEAMRALMGINNQTQHKMILLNTPTKFTFPRWDMTKPRLHESEKPKLLYERYSIPIQDTKFLDVNIKIRLLNEAKHVFVEIWAIQVKQTNPLLFGLAMRKLVEFRIEPHQSQINKEQIASFAETQNDQLCNAIMIHCESAEDDMTFEVSCFKKT
jgi:hypothetical protein